MSKLFKAITIVVGCLIFFSLMFHALAVRSMVVDRIYKNDTYHFTIKYRANPLSYFLPVSGYANTSTPGEVKEYYLQGSPPFSVAVVRDKIKFDAYFAQARTGGGCGWLKDIPGYSLYICTGSGVWPALQEHMPQ